jgi:hypothetical protein
VAAVAVVGLMAELASGCGSVGPANAPVRGNTAAPYPSPPGPSVAAEFGYQGPSMVGPWFGEINAPPVVVYTDGTVIASASRMTRLSQGDLARLLDVLRGDLSAYSGRVKPRPGWAITDVTDTVLRVRLAGGTLKQVAAYGLAESAEFGASGYPGPLTAAVTRLRALAAQTLKTGTPYDSSRTIVLLTCSILGVVPAPAPEWPAGVAQPTVRGPARSPACDERQVLTGAAARIARAAFADIRGAGRPAARVYTSALGLRAGWWRPALPGENPRSGPARPGPLPPP